MVQNFQNLINQDNLAKRGIFYVGGHISGNDGRHHMCNQMFIEAYIPKEIRCPYPLVFFHGAGQTNVNWLTTPDGRMGWADYFVSQGYCVYLAEQPARGRSAYHPEENGPVSTTLWKQFKAVLPPMKEIGPRPLFTPNGPEPQRRTIRY